MNDQDNYKLYDKANRNENIIGTIGFIGVVAAATYGGTRLGVVAGNKYYANNLEAANNELTRLQQSEKMGNKAEPVRFNVLFERAGETVDSVEFRPVPIAKLKAEQTQHINQLKADGPSVDIGASILGGVLCFFVSAFAVVKAADFLEENVVEPVALALAKGENATIRGFKAASDFVGKKIKKAPEKKDPAPGIDN